MGLKIAVAGKGGAGKTTLAGGLALYYSGANILVSKGSFSFNTFP